MKTFAATVVASSALLSLASGQTYQIDPNSVTETTRDYWCNSQKTQCPLICLQPPSETATLNDNSCDPDTLTFSCVCGDGLSPNVTQYTQTLPYFICSEWGNQCVTGCNGDNTCSSACRQDHPCGAQDPIRPNSSTITSTMSSSSSRTASEAGATTDGSGGTVYSGFGGGASATGDSSSASESSASSQAADSGVGRASASSFGQTFGLLALAGAFFGGFALVL
jgi:hypothetical protein